MRFLLLTALLGSALASPLALFTQTACSPSKTITLTPGAPWILQQTLLASNQFCTYTFVVPSGYFAEVSISADDMSGAGDETVQISDAFGERVMPVSYTQFSSTLAWPTNFQVNVQSSRGTTMKVAASIMLYKNLLGQNNTQTLQVGLNSPSAVIYPDDIKQGQTITINAQTAMSINPALAYWQDETFLNNIFVYDNGKLLGTLLSSITNQEPIVSSSKTIQIYIAMGSALKFGAVVITDTSNLVNIYRHYTYYVPLSQQDHTDQVLLYGDETKGGAITIVGAKDGSNPYDVRGLNSISSNAGSYSYVVGGPQNSHAQDTQLDPKALPKHITSSVTTFYISLGEGVIKYTLS